MVRKTLVNGQTDNPNSDSNVTLEHAEQHSMHESSHDCKCPNTAMFSVRCLQMHREAAFGFIFYRASTEPVK